MAIAVVNKIKPVPGSISNVSLTLSPAEAVTLHTIMNKIAGDCDESIRKHSDSIAGALGRAGVPSINGFDYPGDQRPCHEKHDVIYFLSHSREQLAGKLTEWAESLSEKGN